MKGKRQYSSDGNNSRQFWGRVKALKNESHHDTAYMLGVVLQELESRVLNFLEGAEEVQRRPAKGASDAK